MIYPTGYSSADGDKVDFNWRAARFGIGAEIEAITGKNGVSMDQEIWVPGAMMSYRDIGPMLECLLLVNDLPGGEGHHDGHMKGRDAAEVLATPMLTRTAAQQSAFDEINAAGGVLGKKIETVVVEQVGWSGAPISAAVPLPSPPPAEVLPDPTDSAARLGSL